jgi:hypothetical protein
VDCCGLGHTDFSDISDTDTAPSYGRNTSTAPLCSQVPYFTLDYHSSFVSLHSDLKLETSSLALGQRVLYSTAIILRYGVEYEGNMSRACETQVSHGRSARTAPLPIAPAPHVFDCWVLLPTYYGNVRITLRSLPLFVRGTAGLAVFALIYGFSC